MKALPYFNTSAETTLQMDASKKGLGACLIQNGKVVCYTSRALTKTEQNYQNLEREALGTIWGMEKFHYFLYGKEFTLETDQKPLVSICRATTRPPRPSSTAECLRLIARLRGEQASAASWEPRPPFEATEMD